MNLNNTTKELPIRRKKRRISNWCYTETICGMLHDTLCKTCSKQQKHTAWKASEIVSHSPIRSDWRLRSLCSQDKTWTTGSNKQTVKARTHYDSFTYSHCDWTQPVHRSVSHSCPADKWSSIDNIQWVLQYYCSLLHNVHGANRYQNKTAIIG